MNQNTQKALYFLSVVSLFLPWFSYNPKMTGYCWGFHFWNLFLIPMVLTGLYYFRFNHSKIMFLLCQLSLAANLMILVAAFGKWQDLFNIQSGFHWADGFRTARPGFWIAAVIFTIQFVVFQVDALINRQRAH